MAKVNMSMQEKNKFAQENIGLIHAVAHTYDNSAYPYEERFQVASVGFSKALNTYDNEKGTKLSTYCVECMKNELGEMHRRATAACRSHMASVSIDAAIITNKNKTQRDHHELLSADDSMEDNIVTSITLNKTIEVMREILSPEQYRALMMFAFGGFSYVQIAKKTADSLENVRKLIRSARGKLKNDPRIHR